MGNRSLILVLGLVVLSSGCMDGGSGSGISVDRLEIEPGEIYEGNTVSVVLEARNAGLLQGKVDTGDEKGTDVLTNYCPDQFDIKDFQARTPRGEESENVYTLGEGERIEMQWRLEHSGEAPQFGYSCPLRFELPFNYSVTAFKELQVVDERDVEFESAVGEDVSQGPLSFDMELIGSSMEKKNTFLRGEDVSIYLTAYNKGENEESPYLGLIEMESIDIETSGVIDIKNQNCLEEQNVVLSSGDENIYRCNIEVKEDFSPPSSKGEIRATVNYTYVRDIGERQVKVNPSGR